MLHMPTFIVAQTFDDFKLPSDTANNLSYIENHLNNGGIVVVDVNNKFFSTRILDGGKRMRITESVVIGTARVHEIPVGKGPRAIARTRTQVTNKLGHLLKFEAYYLEYKLTPSDLRDEIIKYVPNV